MNWYIQMDASVSKPTPSSYQEPFRKPFDVLLYMLWFSLYREAVTQTKLATPVEQGNKVPSASQANTYGQAFVRQRLNVHTATYGFQKHPESLNSHCKTTEDSDRHSEGICPSHHTHWYRDPLAASSKMISYYITMVQYYFSSSIFYVLCVHVSASQSFLCGISAPPWQQARHANFSPPFPEIRVDDLHWLFSD